MPRYVVERSFPDGLQIPLTDEGTAACQAVVRRNDDFGVTWVHSYVSEDKRRTFCVYDGPDAESIRKAAALNGLPVDRVTRVSVLDPYFYR
jgi:Protein of unknown function (DUF4242)